MKNSLNSIENLQREYAKSVELANQNIKFAEQSIAFEDDNEEIQISGLSLPAINELRCSASHISFAFSTDDTEKQKLAYQQAIQHCKRASYEAMDALLQYYLKECRRFQNDYRTVQIDNVPKDYQDDCLYLNEIKSKLPSRSEYENAKYQVIFKEILEKVGIIYRKWDTARLELNKKLAEENRKRTIQFYTILFSAITAGGTILGLILKLL